MAAIEHKIGDTFVLNATALDETGAVIDLTGYTISSAMKPPRPTGPADKVTHTVTITDAINGKFTVRTEAADTLQWKAPAPYTMDITFVDPSGDVTSTNTIIVVTVSEIA